MADKLLIVMVNTDPRNATDFGAAFALGTLAAVLDAGSEVLTLAGFAGPRGLLLGDGLIPLAAVIRRMASLAGQPARPLVSSDPARVRGIEAGGRHLLVNLTPSPVTVHLDAERITLEPYAIRL